MPETAGARTPTALPCEESMRQKQLLDYEGSEVTCPKCGNTFSGKSGFGRHHSIKHGGKYKPLAVCDTCGEVHRVPLGNIQNAERQFCSDVCRKEWVSEWYSDESNPLYKEPIEKTCKCCGAEFDVKPSCEYRQYCSQSCYHTHSREEGMKHGENNAKYKEKVSMECGQCGSGFEVHEYREKTAKFCSEGCMYDAMSERIGTDNPHWKHGKNIYRAVKRSLGPSSWRQIADEARNQSCGTCELCGCVPDEDERPLSMHHIIPIMSGGDNGDYNFMSLCRGCHHTVEAYTKSIPEIEAVLTE